MTAESANKEGPTGLGPASPVTKSSVQALVFGAVDLLNETLADDQQFSKLPEAILVETGGNLDSMAVVNLLVLVEDQVAERFGKELNLLDSHPLDPEDLKTLGSFIEAVYRRLAQ